MNQVEDFHPWVLAEGRGSGVPQGVLAIHQQHSGLPVIGVPLAGFGPQPGKQMHFILVCKPTSHPLTHEWVDFLDRGGAVRTVVRHRRTGRRHEIDTYRHAETLPLRDGNAALMVNWCELATTDKNGKVLYHNTFVTNLATDDHQAAEGAAAGRRRWEIENENNNTLKIKGYHFEHHYGHGQQHLASRLASLIILAFLVHTVSATLSTSSNRY